MQRPCRGLIEVDELGRGLINALAMSPFRGAADLTKFELPRLLLDPQRKWRNSIARSTRRHGRAAKAGPPTFGVLWFRSLQPSNSCSTSGGPPKCTLATFEVCIGLTSTTLATPLNEHGPGRRLSAQSPVELPAWFKAAYAFNDASNFAQLLPCGRPYLGSSHNT